jgi:Holliday junction resolvase
MPLNSKRKGARGERELAAALRAWGHGNARRGQQFKGTEDSPDVQGLPGFFIEAKFTESLSLYPALERAVVEAGHGTIPVVMHRRRGKQWVAILRLDDLMKLIAKV